MGGWGLKEVVEASLGEEFMGLLKQTIFVPFMNAKTPQPNNI